MNKTSALLHKLRRLAIISLAAIGISEDEIRELCPECFAER